MKAAEIFFCSRASRACKGRGYNECKVNSWRQPAAILEGCDYSKQDNKPKHEATFSQTWLQNNIIILERSSHSTDFSSIWPYKQTLLFMQSPCNLTELERSVFMCKADLDIQSFYICSNMSQLWHYIGYWENIKFTDLILSNNIT